MKPGQALAILEALERALDALTGKVTDEDELHLTKMIVSLRVGQLRADVRREREVVA